MLIKYWTIARVIVLSLFLLVVIQPASLTAQSEPDYWVYDVFETDDSYEITRTYALNGITESITTIPKYPTFSLASIMPDEEIAVAERFMLEQDIYDTEPEGFAYRFFDNPPLRSTLRDIAPSPDNTTLALVIDHVSCLRYPSMVCFGVSQISLLTIGIDEDETLWSLPRHAHTSFIPSCGYVSSHFTTPAYINEIRWTSDQKALVAALKYGRSLPGDPLVVIPINDPESAFPVGDGSIGWTIASGNQEITTLSIDCSSTPQDAVNVISFDYNNGQVTPSSYALPASIVRVYQGFIGHLQEKTLFAVELFSEGDAAGDFDRLAILDPNHGDTPEFIHLDINGYKQIKASPSGEVAAIKDNDGLLWQIVLEGDDLTVQPITTMPVTYWHFADDDELVVMFEGSTAYTIIDVPEIE